MEQMTVSTQTQPGVGWLMPGAPDPRSIRDIFSINGEPPMVAKCFKELAEKYGPKCATLHHKGFNAIEERNWWNEAAESGVFAFTGQEKYGGMAYDLLEVMFLHKAIGWFYHGLGTTATVQEGIGRAPIEMFGSEFLREKYLTRMAAGELRTCYALTDGDHGSDAANVSMTATDNGDGTYTLNGGKTWISNAVKTDKLEGADTKVREGVAVVFAQVLTKGGEKKLTSFVVELNQDGVTITDAAKEKHALHASKTSEIAFEGVVVQAENIIGEVGDGKKIFMFVINFGRFALAAIASGTSEMLLNKGIKYSLERKQGDAETISEYGNIQHLIADAAANIFGMQSAVFRTAGNMQDFIDQNLAKAGGDYGLAKALAGKEYMVECALLKVFNSEGANNVAADMFELMGGMGFDNEMGIANAWDDLKITKTYEGTNKINGMQGVDMTLRKKFEPLGLFGQLTKDKEVWSSFDPSVTCFEGTFAKEQQMIENTKMVARLLLGHAFDSFGFGLAQQQEVLIFCSEIMQHIYVAESALLVAQKLEAEGAKMAGVNEMVKVLVYKMSRLAELNASSIVSRAASHTKPAETASDEEKAEWIKGVRDLTGFISVATRYVEKDGFPFDIISSRRAVATRCIAEGKYWLVNKNAA